MHERAEHRQFEFPPIAHDLAFLRTQERAQSENGTAYSENKEVPVAPNECAHINEELGRGGKFSAEILENFTEDRNHPDNEESSDGQCNAQYDDRISHRGFDLLAKSRAVFQKSGQSIKDFSEETAVLTCLDHADEQPVKCPRMFRQRFIKCLTTLHSHGDVADHIA